MKLNNKDLAKMFAELKLAPLIYVPSSYWQYLNLKHSKHIEKYGLKHFKRVLNKDYFDWGPTGIIPYQLTPLFSELKRLNFAPFFRSRFMDKRGAWKPFYKFQFLSKLIYRIYVAYMYDYISRIDSMGMLKKIQEPTFGSALVIEYRGRSISQNVISSVQEFYSIASQISSDSKFAIGEIGAGYGRLAHIFLRTMPHSTYTIIDIPPALYVSQVYLQKIFPKEKFFLFRPFASFKKIEKEFKKARIKFLMPHQIEYLPKDSFHIMINISSFHEMRRDQIKNYFKQVDRLTKGLFYFKQWKKSNAKDNNFMRQGKYPVLKKWKKMYHRTDAIHNRFFEALYETR